MHLACGPGRCRELSGVFNTAAKARGLKPTLTWLKPTLTWAKPMLTSGDGLQLELTVVLFEAGG